MPRALELETHPPDKEWEGAVGTDLVSFIKTVVSDQTGKPWSYCRVLLSPLEEGQWGSYYENKLEISVLLLEAREHYISCLLSEF